MATSVADLCRQMGISTEQLAERSGLEVTRVTAIVMGRWTPSPTERRSIASVLGLPVDEIVWGHTTPIQHIYGHGPQ